jgi:hypothetical protein
MPASWVEIGPDYSVLPPVDSSVYFLEAFRDPDKLHQILAQMQARFQEARDAAKKSSTSRKDAK